MTDQVFVCQMFIQVQIVEMQYVEENIIYGSKMNPAFKIYWKMCKIPYKKEVIVSEVAITLFHKITLSYSRYFSEVNRRISLAYSTTRK